MVLKTINKLDREKKYLAKENVKKYFFLIPNVQYSLS